MITSTVSPAVGRALACAKAAKAMIAEAMNFMARYSGIRVEE